MSVIDDYLDIVSPAQRNELERIRTIVKEVSPNAEEVISYRIPTFKVNGQPLVYFAVFKNHLSLFPTSKPIEILKDKLNDYKISKGAVQFTIDNPLPKKLIVELLKIRLDDINRT
jgi:uncharacterized protein YdhG (YjbR/CyaY superfamily)